MSNLKNPKLKSKVYSINHMLETIRMKDISWPRWWRQWCQTVLVGPARGSREVSVQAQMAAPHAPEYGEGAVGKTGKQ